MQTEILYHVHVFLFKYRVKNREDKKRSVRKIRIVRKLVLNEEPKSENSERYNCSVIQIKDSILTQIYMHMNS